jgi:hypothetical protein
MVAAACGTAPMPARRMQSKDPGLEVVHPQAAGIDVGNAAHYVAVRPELDPEPVRRFECFTADLHRLVELFGSLSCTPSLYVHWRTSFNTSGIGASGKATFQYRVWVGEGLSVALQEFPNSRQEAIHHLPSQLESQEY